jgi:MraZ protein
VAVHGQERCLSLYPLDWWQTFERELQLVEMTDPMVRRGMRRLLASTEDLQLDNQNRVILSAPLLEFAGIRSQAVLNGVIDRMELWSPESWNGYLHEEGAPAFEVQIERFGDVMKRTAQIVREQRERLARGETGD